LKKLIYLILFVLIASLSVIAQKSTITFTFTSNHTCVYTQPDSILVENLTQGCDTTLYYPDTTLSFIITDIILNSNDQNELFISLNYPNPFSSSTNIDVYTPEKEYITLNVYDLTGRLLTSYGSLFEKGMHSFTFFGNTRQTYLLTVNSDIFTQKRFMIQIGGGNGSDAGIAYNGISSRFVPLAMHSGERSAFIYMIGDELKYTCYVTTVFGYTDSGTITDTPLSSEDYIFDIANASPAQPSAGTNIAYEDQIEWNWIEVANAGAYYWNTTNDFNTATEVGTNTYTQQGLDCETYHEFYVWAWNTCGVSDPLVLQETTTNCPPCSDECIVGDTSEFGVCTLWDDENNVWIEDFDDGDGNMHNRARKYQVLLRNKLMPYGGVFRTIFEDDTYEVPIYHGGPRDAPIWVGTYLASESFRYAVTGSPEAYEQMESSIRTLDFWWRISGDQGYLARYVAPSDCPDVVQNIFQADDPENHLDFLFEDELWHWKGDISRDQYQGVLFGYSIAYDMLEDEDEELKEVIRKNVVEFVEQLMVKETRTVHITIGGLPMDVDMELEHVIYTTHETESGEPTLTITISPFELVDDGFLSFWPDPTIYINQIPGFGWVPQILQRSQAIQLGGAFRVALQVTEGIPEYAARREAIMQHYLDHYDEWVGYADDWSNTNNCGDSYHGLNIAMYPMFNWARLEDDPDKLSYLRNDVFKDRLWSAVEDHKNVFFAYEFASQADPTFDVTDIITTHNAQLAQFPPSPYWAWPVDNTALYPEDPDCPGLSSVAIDIEHRQPRGFIWEKNPWELYDEGTPNYVFPGVDYMVAYWMGRFYGYLEDDAPNTCLKWKEY